MNDYAIPLSYYYIDGRSEHYVKPHEIQNRTFPFCVVVSVKEGEYFVDINNKTFCVTSGETIFIKSFVKHTVRMVSPGKLSFAHFLCNYASIDVFSLVNVDHFVVSDKKMQELINAMGFPAYNNKIAQKLYRDKLLCEMFLRLLDLNVLCSETFFIEPWLNATLKYIHLNCYKGITVHELISVSGHSKTSFYQLFQQRMKVSPREYIESERFKIASMLLLEGKKVTEVAKAIGFNDISYFNKVFKRRYGVTPIEHKRKMNYSKG